jgi:membrane protein implicated in regulation of membrane protease activity
MSFNSQLLWLLAGTSSSNGFFLFGFVRFSPMIFWLIVGTMLCLVELAVPTAFTAFMMGIAALAVAMVLLVLPIPLALQVILWMGFSLAFVYAVHRFMPKHKNRAIAESTEAKVLTEILPGEIGRVIYEGNSWQARCSDEKMAIAANQKVYVVGREGNTLFVMPINLLSSDN